MPLQKLILQRHLLWILIDITVTLSPLPPPPTYSPVPSYNLLEYLSKLL